MMSLDYRLTFAIWLLISWRAVPAGDWPTWRYDAGRTASSPDSLPGQLDLIWSRQFPQRQPCWDDPLNWDLMPFDRVFEPIVVGKRIILPFNDSDKVVAFDTETGREVWRRYVNGPVRFGCSAANGKVYFVSDDGWLYCLKADDGETVWKFQGAPSAGLTLGNRRLISRWPARGAPVIYDGTVYFAASIWPLMGTFIYALDANTGSLVWINDGLGAQWINQPHNSPAFAGIAPQGSLVATEKLLLVPGGRSVPAALDRQSGKLRYFHLAKNGKTGGASVYADGDDLFVYHRVGKFNLYSLTTGTKQDTGHGYQPVLSKEAIYYSGKQVSRVARDPARRSDWKIKVDATGDLIRAGDSLLAAGDGVISSVPIKKNPKVEWTKRVEGKVRRLIAADNKLFAVTQRGRILAFGKSKQRVARAGQSTDRERVSFDTELAEAILAETDDRSGYAIVYGAGDGSLVEALVELSQFHVIVFEPDESKVARLRRRWDDVGLYGNRIAIQPSDLNSNLPPYLSKLTIVAEPGDVGWDGSPQAYQVVFRSLRPYGGVAWIKGEPRRSDRALAQFGLEKAEGRARADGLVVERVGALPGAGSWTHQYGNSANTIKSNDSLVKLPLGVLWFGGNSNVDVLPRHGHGPPEQVIGGRLFIQGMDSLSARDVYTGQVLWKVELRDLETFGVFFDKTHKDTPLSTAYNQVHIPGANARGTNFVATADRVYVAERHRCRVLDSRTGETLELIDLPGEADQSPARWAYIAVSDNVLVGGAGFAEYSKAYGLPHDKSVEKSKWRFTDYDQAASVSLAGMDRVSGEPKWQTQSKYGFWHNAIALANGVMFCIDRLPTHIEQHLKRRGKQVPKDYQLTAMRLDSGELLWRKDRDVHGTWLAYDEQLDILLQSTRPSRDTISGEDGKRMTAFRGKSGELLWDRQVEYGDPPILHSGRIIAGRNMLELKTGKVIKRVDPVTGAEQPWSYSKAYGCAYPVACDHLLTFRSSAAGFFDLSSDGGTGNFGGFKGGCTSNLVAADGVLNAPDYTRTCSCSFQNQTSLALVHMPEVEMWTHNDFKIKSGIEKLGINLGAAGDRRAGDGTLWLEYPPAGAPTPELAIALDGELKYFRHHSSRFEGRHRWVVASGVEGVRKLTLQLGGQGNSEPGTVRRCRVRLFFTEPDPRVEPGERLLDIDIQGKKVAEAFDPSGVGGEAGGEVVRTFEGIEVSEQLEIQFYPRGKRPPLLCGLEVSLQQADAQ